VREHNVPEAAKEAPFFFLSYAHSQRNGSGKPPELDYWVQQLFGDLCNRINSLTSVPRGCTAGFMDRELLPGHDWPIGLAHSLATCRVFVPLYSRRYFESEHCGKEWSAFTQRTGDREASAPSAIVPAVWVPVEEELLPAVARSIPCDYAGLQPYADYGFYGIIKLSKYRTQYERAVERLARHVVDIAESSPVADGPVLDYASLQSAFEVTAREMSGGRPLRITIVAPSHSELPDGRGSYYYGGAARDWHPYKPASERVLADYVSDVARSLGYRPFVGDFQTHLAELLGEQHPSAPEVLIVDAWATRQEKCREQLTRLDAMDKPWVQVIVPWNRRDSESAVAEAELRDSLEATLRRKLAEGRATSALAVRGVPSLADLDRVLPMVISKAVQQYHRYAPAYPPTGEVVERPRLNVSMQDLSNGERLGD
jgi:FxsC-like protein